MRGTIYLEPRDTFDAALCNANMVWYSFTLLINLLMDKYDLNYMDAVDYYCFNIESLTFKGLVIIEDED
tara:strand:- start:789 stop:995 length:207 start_codon:yes stop_codon:yes gene_type:complete